MIKKTGHTAATSESHQPLPKVTINYYEVCNPATKQLKKIITFFIKIHTHKNIRKEQNGLNSVSHITSSSHSSNKIPPLLLQPPLRLSAVFTGVE